MTIGFIILAALALFTGLGVITAKAPVHSVLFLVGNIIDLAVLYLVLQAEFLAAAQVIVYAGAIMVLFLFVVTLLTAGKEEREGPDGLSGQRGVAAFFGVAAGVLLAGAAVRFGGGIAAPAGAPDAAFGSIQAMGHLLWGTDFDDLVVVALMLLTAALGVIVLNRAESPKAAERPGGRDAR